GKRHRARQRHQRLRQAQPVLPGRLHAPARGPAPAHPVAWHQGGGRLMRTLRRLAAACLTAALLFGTAGCEEDPLAVLGTDRAFTVYGVLNPRADTQFVRVFPIAGRLEPGDGTPLDARVASTDRETGEVREWTQLVRRDASGDYAHLYWAAFRADYGHTYALEVSGSDDR